MKIRSLCTVVLALWTGSLLAQATLPLAASPTANRPVLWSIHFDAARLRAGAGKELFASIDPIFSAFSGENASAPGGKLEALSITGFPPQKGSEDEFPFLADIRFTSEGGGISHRFDAVSKKHHAPVEDIAGSPAIHFQHEGKEVWIAKMSDTRLLLSASRPLLEATLQAGGSEIAAATTPDADEMLGGHVEIKSLLAENLSRHESELLKMLSNLDFHVLSKGDQFDLHASADMGDERSAKRAARMIDGMVAAVSAHDLGGVPWDDRLKLDQDGARVAVQFHLEPQEAKTLFNSFAREIEQQIKASKRDE